jgi:hypothetical protein
MGSPVRGRLAQLEEDSVYTSPTARFFFAIDCSASLMVACWHGFQSTGTRVHLLSIANYYPRCLRRITTEVTALRRLAVRWHRGEETRC